MYKPHPPPTCIYIHINQYCPRVTANWAATFLVLTELPVFIFLPLDAVHSVVELLIKKITTYLKSHLGFPTKGVVGLGAVALEVVLQKERKINRRSRLICCIRRRDDSERHVVDD